MKNDNHNIETLATWNKVAKAYQDKFMDLDIYNTSYISFIKALNHKASKVLELGCGPGNITAFLGQHNQYKLGIYS